MIDREYPILEFDGSTPAVIDIHKNININEVLPDRCVLSFFGDAVSKYVAKNNCKQIGSLKLESFILPIYETNVNNKKIALIHVLGSGPYAAGQIEKLSSMGSKIFLVCGGCGVLEKGSACGDIFVPVSALRDEGTSYHYVAPCRSIEMNAEVCSNICSYLSEHNISFKKVKTWTTDAMYRETEKLIDLRKKEGCNVVETECASFLAVAQFKNLKLGQILYAGDDLSGKNWDSRNWKSNFEARDYLLYLTIDMISLF